MNEQRLIDFGQLYDSISDNWCGLEVASVSDILNSIKGTPPSSTSKPCRWYGKYARSWNE